MRIVLTFLMLAFAVFAALNSGHSGGYLTPVAPAPVSLVGQSAKICQLDGETDWASGKPTAAQTLTNAGMQGGDLGYPVEHKGKLLFFFGDSWPPMHPGGAAGEIPPDDAIGITTRTQTPDASECVGMKVRTSKPKTFARVTVTGPQTINQGFFNVPSGGVNAGGDLYAFFWTGHCDQPANLLPSASDPLARPASSAGCPETDARSSIGYSVLAQSSDDGLTFTIPKSGKHIVSMPIGFVYTIGVDAAAIRGLPSDQKLGVLIFGVPRYRASTPYLAYAPVNSFADPSTWKFFTGLSSKGKPTWVSTTQWAAHKGPWAPPTSAEILAPTSDADRCIGEFSVTWNRPLHSWLMLYNCSGSGILARVADAPWGPWSAPTTLLSAATPGVHCTLIMQASGCGGQTNSWPKKKDGTYVEGGFYAPFVMNRYTEDVAGPTRTATIYWVVSTWNPYEVVVMQSTLASTISRPTPMPRPSFSPRPFPVPSHPI